MTSIADAYTEPFNAKLKRWLVPVIPFLLLVGIWASAVAIYEPPIGTLPGPDLVARAPFANSEQYLSNIWASIQRLVAGFVVAATSGIIVGVAAGLNKRIAEFLGPLTTFMSALSGIAWIPLAVAWFGPGTGMVVFIVWNAAFFLIFSNTMLGVRLVPKVLENGMLTMGASRLQVILQVTIPGSMPYIMSGLRSGLGFGWRAVIAAELVGAASGLGYWIFEQRDFSRMDNIIAAALTIGVIGMVMDRWLLARLERRTIERWGLVGTNE